MIIMVHMHVCIKGKYLQAFFSFFQNFDVWDHWAKDAKKGKKWHKMTKDHICLTLYLRNCTSYDCDFCYACVK